MFRTAIRTKTIQKSMAKYLQHWKRFLWSLRSDFRPALYSLFIILIPSSLLLPLTYIAPSVANELHSSRLTPWGLFTSIWVHFDLEHYAGNMLALLLFVLLFASIQENYSSAERLRRSIVLLWNPIMSAVVANVYTLTVLPMSSATGASGAVFAYLGICFAYAVLNAWPSSFGSKDLREHFLKSENRRMATGGFGILVIFLLLFYFNPVPAHFMGFLAGLGLTGIYETTHPQERVSRTSPLNSTLALGLEIENLDEGGARSGLTEPERQSHTG